MTAHVPTSSAMIAGDVLDKQYSQRTPLVYRSIRFLFKQVSRVFYKQIEVVGLSLLPPDGVPTCVSSHVTEIEVSSRLREEDCRILCANHSSVASACY